MMPVKNEWQRKGGRLRRVLHNLEGWVDEIVVLNDASTDCTSELCLECPKVTILVRSPEPLFSVNESSMRSRLWQIAVERRPDWLLAIDADELFEERIVEEIDGLVNQREYDAIDFRLFDFWKGETHYRVDGAWNPWNRFVRFLVRYDPHRQATWPNLPVHSGRWPLEYRRGISSYQSDVRVKHLGWVNPEEHRQKYEFYAEWDRRLYGRVMPHTESILLQPESIILEPWVEIKPPMSPNPGPLRPDVEIGPDFFDEDYFERGYQIRKSNYKGYTEENVMPMAVQLAGKIESAFHPKTALDVGCAKGFYVLALRRLGIQAVGIDWSSYALRTAPEEIRKYLTMADIAEIPFGDGTFDVTLCLDVLEHISGERLETVLNEVGRVTRRYLVIVTPTGDHPTEDDRDPSHTTIMPRKWWIDQFAQRGFKPIELDLTPVFERNNSLAFEREVKSRDDDSIPTVDGMEGNEATPPPPPRTGSP